MSDPQVRLGVWRKKHAPRPKELLIIEELRKITSNDTEVAEILEILDRVCLNCFDKETPCSCKQ